MTRANFFLKESLSYSCQKLKNRAVLSDLTLTSKRHLWSRADNRYTKDLPSSIRSTVGERVGEGRERKVGGDNSRDLM